MSDRIMRLPETGERIEFDPRLESLARHTNLGKCANVPVTIIIGGQVISGVIVSMTDFIRGAESIIRESDVELMVADAQRILDANHETPAQLIHLRDAYVLHAQTTIPLGWWRGRLSEIAGFSFGLAKSTGSPTP